MKKLLLIFFLILIWVGLTSPALSYAHVGVKHKPRPVKDFDWQGVYNWGESSGKNTGMVIDYTITVYRQDGVLVADLEADGFQTQARISCEVKASGDKLQLFFKGYRKDNLFEIYKPGEHLLSLEVRNRKLRTHWEALKPQLASFKNGGVYFTKQRRRKASNQ